MKFDFYKEMKINLKEQGFKESDMHSSYDSTINEWSLKLDSPSMLAEKERKNFEPLTEFLRKVFPNMTRKQGDAVWWLIHNKDLIVKGKNISGSFRYNGACIAEVVGKGTSYITFYMSSPKDRSLYGGFTKNYAYKLRGKIIENGGKIREIK